MVKIMFVCHGNICRSPMAEFLFRDMVKKAGREGEISCASSAVSAEEIWGENPLDIEAARNPVEVKKKTVRKTASKAKPVSSANSDAAEKPVRKRTKKVSGDKSAEG